MLYEMTTKSHLKEPLEAAYDCQDAHTWAARQSKETNTTWLVLLGGVVVGVYEHGRLVSTTLRTTNWVMAA